MSLTYKKLCGDGRKNLTGTIIVVLLLTFLYLTTKSVRVEILVFVVNIKRVQKTKLIHI